MSKPINPIQRITDYFMNAPLPEAKTGLATAQAIVRNRERNDDPQPKARTRRPRTDPPASAAGDQQQP